jgi:hypothetical protein
MKLGKIATAVASLIIILSASFVSAERTRRASLCK